MPGNTNLGTVDFPSHMERTHQAWLYDAIEDTPTLPTVQITSTMVDVINAAQVGGPWNEAPYTDPATKLAVSQAEFDTFASVLTSMAYDTSWGDLVTTAMNKVDDTDVLTSLVASTLRTDVEPAILSQIIQAVSAIGHGLDERADYIGALAAVLAEVDDSGFLTTIDSATIASNTSTAVAEAMTGADTKAESLADHFSDYAADFALVETELPSWDVDVGAAITSARANALTLLSAGTTAIVSPVDPETDFASIATTAKDEADKHLEVLDLATQRTSAKTASDTAIAGALAAIVENLNAENTWGSAMTAAVAKADLAGVLSLIASSTIRSDSVTAADTEIAAALSAISTSLDPETDWVSVISSAVAKVDDSGVLGSIDMSSLATTARERGETAMLSAISAAVNAISESVIASVVSTYVSTADDRRAQSVRRFTGQMADINATHSSAFLWGMAFIENKHLEDTDRFEAELKMSVYDRALQQSIDLYKNQLVVELQAEVQEKVSRETLIQQGSQLMAAMIENETTFKRAFLNEHVRAYIGQLGVELEADIEEKRARDALVREGAAQIGDLSKAELGYEGDTVKTYAQVYGQEAERGLNVEVVEKQARDDYMKQGIVEMAKMIFNDTQYRQAFLQLHNEAYGMSLTPEMQSKLGEKEHNLGFLNQQMGEATRRSVANDQFYIDLVRMHVAAYQQVAAMRTGADIEEMKSRDQHLLNGLQTVQRMIENRTGFERAFLDLYSKLYGVNLDASFKVSAINKQAREGYLFSSAEVLSRQQMALLQLYKDAAALQTEISRIEIVADDEYTTAINEQEYREQTWDLEILERGIAALGITGGGHFVPKGPTKAGSAIGGALSGAALGAQVGGPPGAAVGGVAGGIAGLLQ